MADVTVRELRNDGGRILDRVASGEAFVVTRDGHPVAELRPLPSMTLDSATLLSRWRRLPDVDPKRLRTDIDRVIDASL